MNPDVARLIERGGGVFTTAEARVAGLSACDLVRLVKRGDIEHLARGVYAGPAPGPLTSEAKHLRLATGVCRIYPDAILTHQSAVVSLGLPVWNTDLTRVLAARSVANERIARHWIIRPRQPWVNAVAGPAGPRADVSAAVVQHALESGAVQGIVAADQALRQGKCARSDLEDLAEKVAGWPGAHHVRTMLALADGRSESVGESRLRVDLTMGGLDVVPQVVISDENGRVVARVDFMIRGTKVVIEFDGLVKYRERGSEALIAEKRREDELRRLGYVVLRFIWSDLSRPDKILARVRAAVATSQQAPLGKVHLHRAFEVG